MTDAAPHIVLLDRDGVINKDLPGSVCRVDDFEMLPGSAEAVAVLNHKGYRVLILTNQACVGRGDLTASGLEAIHQSMRRQIADAGGELAGIYVCPHTDEDSCDCRKPRPGLIEQAYADFRFDRGSTWLVGDSDRDIEAAVSAGVRPAFVRSGKGLANSHRTDVAVFDNLAQFARELEHHGTRT